jgi:hypothetical protein
MRRASSSSASHTTARGEPRFLVIAQLHAAAERAPPVALLPGLTALPRERLIVHRELFMPDDARPAGVVFGLQAPGREDVDALVQVGPAGLREHFAAEILDWEFGGRR